jgi:hypothetical protein
VIAAELVADITCDAVVFGAVGPQRCRRPPRAISNG